MVESDRDLEGTWFRRDDGSGGLEMNLAGCLLRVKLIAKGSYLGEVFSGTGGRLVALKFDLAGEAKSFLTEWAMSLNGKPT